MDGDSQQQASRPDVLNRDAVIRWEVINNDPLVSRKTLARLLPQAVESLEQLREFEEESRRAVPLLRALLRIVVRLAHILLELAVVTLMLFGVVWLAAGFVGHPAILSAVAYGLAAYLTGLVAYEAMKYVLTVSVISRQKIAKNIKGGGLLAIPLLMYATASPTTTMFVNSALRDPPSMLSWVGFFAYMFADVVSLGMPQALFGELTAFQPPSLLAAANTLWIKSLMTFAVAGTVVSTMVKVIATRHTFVGTLDELTEWLRVEFPRDDSSYTVRPIALERAFATSNSGVPLRHLRDHNEYLQKVTPPWRVDVQGKFVNPFGEGEDYDKGRKGIYSALASSYLIYKQFNHEKVKATARAELTAKLALWLPALFVMALVFASTTTVLAGLLDYTWLDATAIAFLITVLVITLAALIDERHKRDLLLDLLHCKQAVLSGHDSRSPPFFAALDRWAMRSMRIMLFRPLEAIPSSLEQVLQSSVSRGRPDHFEILGLKDADEIWLLHAMPFHMQGKLVKAIYEKERRIFVFFDAAGAEEEFDFLGVRLTNDLHEHLSSCRKLTLLHCPRGRAPSRPWHVQEMPLEILLAPKTLPVHEHRKHYRDKVEMNQDGTVSTSAPVKAPPHDTGA